MPVQIDEKQCFSFSVRMDPFAKPRPSSHSPVCTCQSVDRELLLCLHVECLGRWHHICRETGQKSQRKGESSKTVINQLLFREHRSTSTGALKHHSPSKPNQHIGLSKVWSSSGRKRKIKNKWPDWQPALTAEVKNTYKRDRDYILRTVNLATMSVDIQTSANYF